MGLELKPGPLAAPQSDVARRAVAILHSLPMPIHRSASPGRLQEDLQEDWISTQHNNDLAA